MSSVKIVICPFFYILNVKWRIQPNNGGGASSHVLQGAEEVNSRTRIEEPGQRSDHALDVVKTERP